MEGRILSRACVKATSSLSVCRHATNIRPPLSTRYLHSTGYRDATPLSHPTVPGPPPSAPQAAVTYQQERIAKKKQQAELLRKGQQAKPDPSKPRTALQKRFWKNVSVKETEDGLQVLLDTRPVRTAARQILTIPHSKRAVATSIAIEWDQLVSAQQALKQHYIPMTSLVSRANDVAMADKDGNTATREAIVTMCMRYLSTDTLLCWAPEKNIHEPEPRAGKTLRQRQRETAEPIIAFLQTHIFPGVDINPVLDEESIVPIPQPEVTRQIIQGWLSGLPA